MLTVFLIAPFLGICQNIITIAGNGTSGFGGDGGAATSAKINYAADVMTDNAGNVYFSDCLNNRVRKISAAGIITTIAGTGATGSGGDGGPATAAQFNFPYGLAMDDSGNIYVADFYNQKVRKINTSGIISTIAGTGTGGYSGDGGPATLAEIWIPNYVCTDHSGNIYISDNQNNRIRKVNSAGIISTYAGNGYATYGGDGGPATAASLNYPNQIRIDGSGNMYIGDHINYRIRKVSPSGIITTIAGNGTPGFSPDGTMATAAELEDPLAICIDNSGNVYFSDFENYRIRKVSSSGILTTIAGNGTAAYSGDGGPATAAEINGVGGLFMDADGAIFIADGHNYRVREITSPNHPPRFVRGSLIRIDVCENAIAYSLDSALAIVDSDFGQTESWSTLRAPMHGALVAAYTTTSTGGEVIPSGLSYTPTTGYTGVDSFRVRISDGLAIDSTIFLVSVDPLPSVDSIHGPSTVCIAETITLMDSSSGGAWLCFNAHAMVNATGIVTGVSGGLDTVKYSVTNSCGTAVAIKSIKVYTAWECDTADLVHQISNQGDEFNIFPNPAQNTITVQANSGNPIGSIEFINELGQSAMMLLFNNSNAQIDISSLQTGFYFIKITEGGNYFYGKIYKD